MKGIVGRKVGVTQVFKGDDALTVTVVEAGPCVVVQKRIPEKDGYSSLQLGFMDVKNPEKLPKALAGHFAKKNLKPLKYLREVKFDGAEKFNEGDNVTVDIFKPGEKVNVSGITKGRGFAGFHKRWNFKGGPKAHGSDFHERPGSIGACAYPGKLFKGKRMAGHYGNDKVTVRNLEVVDVLPDKNILLIKGAIPGYRGSLVVINGR
ncbi:MAG: 50S ribosomal protein L3 [Nitrospiraceae bacterium]|nr:50S ribosomal protein L3 [Nitrospiraceae bacterium]